MSKTTITPSSSSSTIEANRRNAQASTGPRTPEGKARSSQNARKHGLSATHLKFANDEEKHLYASLEAELRAAIRPQGELENIFFDQALFAQWFLRSCRIQETEALAEQNEARLRAVDRYIRRHEASFRRAIAELRLLQTARAQNEPASISNAASAQPPAQPPLADAAKVQRYWRTGAAALLHTRLDHHLLSPTGPGPAAPTAPE